MSQRDLLPSVSSRTGAALITVAVFVAVAGPGVAVGSVGASDSPDDLSVQAQQESTEAAVSLVPDATVAVDETTTYDVVVEPESADGRIGAYDLTVEVSDSTVASFTGADLKGAIVPPEPIADDGSSVRVAGALGDEDQALTDDNGDGAVTVATVTVTGDTQGESDLSLSVDTISTASGSPYEVTEVDGGSITVESDSSDDEVSGGSNSDPGTDSSDGDGTDSGDGDGADSGDGDGTDSGDGDGADSGDGDSGDGDSDVESGATTDQGDTSQSDTDATSDQEQQQESAADSSETEPEPEAGGFQNPTVVVLVALVSFVAILTAVYYLRRQ